MSVLTNTRLPNSWSGYPFWQYSQSGSAPGTAEG